MWCDSSCTNLPEICRNVRDDLNIVERENVVKEFLREKLGKMQIIMVEVHDEGMRRHLEEFLVEKLNPKLQPPSKRH